MNEITHELYAYFPQTDVNKRTHLQMGLEVPVKQVPLLDVGRLCFVDINLNILQWSLLRLWAFNHIEKITKHDVIAFEIMDAPIALQTLEIHAMLAGIKLRNGTTHKLGIRTNTPIPAIQGDFLKIQSFVARCPYDYT